MQWIVGRMSRSRYLFAVYDFYSANIFYLLFIERFQIPFQELFNQHRFSQSSKRHRKLTKQDAMSHAVKRTSIKRTSRKPKCRYERLTIVGVYPKERRAGWGCERVEERKQ